MNRLFTFLFCLHLFSCSFFDRKKEIKEYLEWVKEENHGLVKTKYVNGLELRVRFLPAEYLAYQELQSDKKYTETKRDSLIASYSGSLTFLVSIATDEREKPVGDVMFLDLENMQGYKERMQAMNFDMNEVVELAVGDQTYKPVLTNMQNTYGLSNGRSITCVFAPGKNIEEFKKEENIDLIWDDELFGSGRNHFVFNSKDFWSLPGLKF